MEERSNKTIMSSVLFLDIVEYSKKSVAGQISLKERFNAYLAEAIRDMPVADRIILDTGDGAAVNFLGDIEDALKAALSLRESLLGEDIDLKPELLVRIGINLGPVRLMRDLNGQPNIVGDGINVAQRIMSFADPSQILVSRSYYDAVSRLSSQYAGMFHYQGSRTDKHVREHEVYAIGYPGDYTTKKMPAKQGDEAVQPRYVEMLDSAKLVCSSLLGHMGGIRLALSEKIKQGDTRQRIIYAALVIVPLMLLGGVVIMHGKSGETQPASVVETMQATSGIPAIAAVSAVQGNTPLESADEVKQDAQKSVNKADVSEKPAASKLHNKTPIASKDQNKTPAGGKAQNKTPVSPASESAPSRGQADNSPANADAYILLRCKEGAQVFLDGSSKGTVGYGSLTVAAKSGRHKLIINHPSFGLYADEVNLEPGKILRLNPKVCQ